MGFVLVHGGFHRASCWQAVLPLLQFPAVTAELPGRGDRRAVARTGLEEFADAVAEAVAAAPFDRAVLVTHSLSGAMVPGVARRIPERIGHLVFIAAATPAEGQAVVDSVPTVLRLVGQWQARRHRAATMPAFVARRLFGHDSAPDAVRRLVAQLSPESARVGLDPVSWAGLPNGLRRTYVLCERDRAMPPNRQRRQIANLEPCDVVTIDSGHDPFFSRPAELAGILNAIASG